MKGVLVWEGEGYFLMKFLDMFALCSYFAVVLQFSSHSMVEGGEGCVLRKVVCRNDKSS